MPYSVFRRHYIACATSDQSFRSNFAGTYLFLCLHFKTTSLLLFRILSLLCSAISSFSLIHNKHLFDSRLYAEHFFNIFHVTLGFPPFFLTPQYSLDSSLSFLYTSWLNDFLWFPYLNLSGYDMLPNILMVSRFWLKLGKSGIWNESFGIFSRTTLKNVIKFSDCKHNIVILPVHFDLYMWRFLFSRFSPNLSKSKIWNGFFGIFPKAEFHFSFCKYRFLHVITN